MKLTPDSPSAVKRPRAAAGFTLSELLIAVTLFLLVLIGSVYAHIFGLKMAALTQSRLRATNSARAALNYTRDEIREAALFYVGNGSAVGFTNISASNRREGNAVQIYATGDTNTFTRYFVDLGDNTLKRQSSGSTNLQVIASYVTNQIAFCAEDFAGNVLTNDQNNRVLKMTLEFYQWEFAALQPGGSNFFDYYRVQTKTARRAR